VWENATGEREAHRATGMEGRERERGAQGIGTPPSLQLTRVPAYHFEALHTTFHHRNLTLRSTG